MQAMPFVKRGTQGAVASMAALADRLPRSEEHTSELQSPCNLVCRLLLEKKKKRITDNQDVLAGSNLAYNAFVLISECLNDYVFSLPVTDRRPLLTVRCSTSACLLRHQSA